MVAKEQIDDDLLEDEIVETCWMKKTRFQMSLILIQLAALPFFLIILGIYLAFILLWNQSEKCDNICRAMESYQMKAQKSPLEETRQWGSWAFLPKGWEKYYTHPPLDETTETNSSGRGRRDVIDDCQQSRYPFIAALLQNLYEDDREEYLFKCAVPVLPNNWILTTERCIDYPMRDLLVRTNSDYWSKGGTVRKIEKIVPFQELIALQLESTTFDHCLEYLEVPETPVTDSKAVTFLWRTDFSVPLEKRRKYENLERVAMNRSENSVFSCLDKCSTFGSPLIDQYYSYLIGFQFTDNKTIFVRNIFNQVLTSL